MTSDRDAFLAHLDAHADDRVGQVAFADWLEENGEERLAKKMREYDGIMCPECRGKGCIMIDMIPCVVCPDRCGWLHRCQQEGCGKEGIECLPGWYTDEDENDPCDWFCRDHAADHGYCPRCLCMHAGPGRYCDECLGDIRREEAEEEWDYHRDEWDEYEGEDDYP